MFANSCRQANNGYKNQTKPTETNEITITVEGDAGVEIKKTNSFKEKKGITWNEIKEKAINKIITKQNKEIKEWRLKDENGEIIADSRVFEKNETVFVVTKSKENPTPLKDPISITIEVDAGYELKNKKRPCKIEVSKNTTWASLKPKAEAEIKLLENYEKTGWKLEGKDGVYLEDSHIFNTNTTIYATSKKKGEPETSKIIITVKGDEGFKVSPSNTFNVDKNSKWANIKEQVKVKVILIEDFEVIAWHLNNAEGTLITDETRFEESTTVFAVSKRKFVEYKIEHLKENIENENYKKEEEETKSGEAGKNTNAEARQYEGFSCQGLAQNIIKADGSTVVQIKYKRNRVFLILDLDGGKTKTVLKDGENGKKLLEGKFEAKVAVEGLEKENYGFKKWEPELPQTFPDTNPSIIYTAKWDIDSITITVKGDDNINLSSPNTLNIAKGEKWANIKNYILDIAKPKEKFEITEFHLSDKNGKVINDEYEFIEDSVIFVASRHKKITITVTADNNYRMYDPGTIEALQGVFWKDIKKQAEEYVGVLSEYYEHQSWNLDDQNGQVLEDDYIFNENATVYAVSREKTVTITIKADEGYTIIEPTFKVKFGTEWNNWEDSVLHITRTKLILNENFYEKAWKFDNQDGEDIYNDYYEFKEDKTIFACSRRKKAAYNVEHWQENIEDDDFTLIKTVSYKGEAGKNTEATAEQYEGFIPLPFEQALLEAIPAEDEIIQLTIKIKYRRVKVSLILDLNGGETTTELEDGKDGKKILNGKIGAKVKLANLEKAGQFLKNWEPELPTIFSLQDDKKTYLAHWENGKSISIEGDDGLEISSPPVVGLTTEDTKTWADIKVEILAKVSFKTEWSEEDYEIEWRLGGENGELLMDTTEITKSVMIYARVNCTKFKIEKQAYHGHQANVLVGYTGSKPRGKVRIQKNIDCIQNSSFQDCTDIESLDFSSCPYLKEIGSYDGSAGGAFRDCTRLRSINFKGCSSLEKIGEHAFMGCISLTEVDLSPCVNLNIIDASAFEDCSKLRKLNLTGCTKLKRIETRAFLCCGNLNDIDFSSCSELTLIGCDTFAECNSIENVDFSGLKNLAIILGGAFDYCRSLKSLNFSNCSRLTVIKKPNSYNGHGSFENCEKLESVNFTGCTNLVELVGNAFANCKNLKTVDLSSCKQLQKLDAFSNCSSLKDINLTGCVSLKEIGGLTSCENLTKIDLSKCSNLETLGGFTDCINLKEVNITGCDKIAIISRVAFQNCSSLKKLDLSSCIHLKKVGSGAFENTDALEDFKGYAELEEIGQGAFINCNSLKKVDLSSCAKLIYAGSFVNCQNLQTVNLSGCVKLTNAGFSNCSNLKDVNLTGCISLKLIGFYSCKSLTEIDLSSCIHLERIESGAFEKCTKLESINLSGCTELTEIGSDAFNSCDSLKKIDLSSCIHLKKIEFGAFEKCAKLESINLSSCTELTEIESNAFDSCDSLKEIDLSSCIHLEKIEYGAFKKCAKLESINLSGCTELTEIGNNTFDSCDSLKKIDLSSCKKLKFFGGIEGNSLESVNFAGCVNLVTISSKIEGDNLKTVDFSSCSKLKEFKRICCENIDFSGCVSLTSIPESIFSGAEKLKTVNLTGCTGIKEIERTAFIGCEALISIDLSPCINLEKIDLMAFNECEKLESINLSGCSKLKEIGRCAFEKCGSLKNIDFSSCNELNKIDEMAFNACSNLKSINFTNCAKLDKIEWSVFSDCVNLESINFTGCIGLEVIAYYAFRNCSTLKILDLSPCKNITKVLGFSECTNLETLNLAGCAKLKEISSFGYCKKLKNIDFSGCVELININGFHDCSSLAYVDLSSCIKMTEIHNNTFSGCTNAVIKLPYSIINIAYNAFGRDNDSYCKKVLVPNEEIKKLVHSAGFQENRIEIYQ